MPARRHAPARVLASIAGTIARWTLALATILASGTALAADRTIAATGKLLPLSSVTLGSYVSGIVEQVSCDFNAVVTKGQVCARIDPRPYQKAVDLSRASLANSKAKLAQDEASLAYTKATFDRQSILVQRGVASKDQFENAQSSLGQARAQVEIDRAAIAQRQAELESAELNLGYTDIVSPIDGVVLARKVSVGETIASNFQVPSLFVIASDLKRLQLVATVGESDIGALKENDSATFAVPTFPGRSFKAKVEQVRFAPETLDGGVGYAVVLDVDNADLQLRPGMTATIRFTVGK